MVIVRESSRKDPLSGHLFVFFSMRRDRVRIVYWDRDGFAMWTKRLERRRFKLSFADEEKLDVASIEAADLALVLEEIDLARAKRRARWVPRTDAPSTPLLLPR